MKVKLIKLIFVSFFVFLTSFNLQARDVIKYFADMPVFLLPSLESTHKLELIENFNKNATKDTLENLFGGKVRMLQLDTVAQFISIQATSVSRFDMIVLNRLDSTEFITIINTVCGPVCSSYIHFYDTQWKEIKMDFPDLSNQPWLKSPEESINGVKVKDMLKGNFLEYTFNPKENRIEVKNNTSEMLGSDEQALIKPYLADETIYVKWANAKWEAMK